MCIYVYIIYIIHHIRRTCCNSELCNEVNWKDCFQLGKKPRNQRPETPRAESSELQVLMVHGRVYKVVSFASCCRTRSAMSGFNPWGVLSQTVFFFFVAHWYA